MLKRIVNIALMAVLPVLMLGGSAYADTTGGIRGYAFNVNDEPYKPLAGVRIWVQSRAASAETTTDAQGFFVFFGLPPGYYTISAERDGFAPRSEIRCVSAGAMVGANFKLFSRLVDPAYVHWRPLPLNSFETADVYNLIGDRSC